MPVMATGAARAKVYDNKCTMQPKMRMHWPAQAKKQIAETEVEIKKSSQSREAENAEFQRVVADQRATQSILAKALQKLKDFYMKNMGSKAATPP